MFIIPGEASKLRNEQKASYMFLSTNIAMNESILMYVL